MPLPNSSQKNAPAADEGRRIEKSSLIIPCLLVLFTFFLLFDPPSLSASLSISDSIEYAVGGYRWYQQGSYTLPLNDLALPPRYLPWFSVFVGLPFLAGNLSIGYAAYPVVFLAILGVVGAFLCGAKISGRIEGAIFASCALLILPEYRYFGRTVMTDVPVTVITLWLSFLYIRRSSNPLVGILIACAFSWRPLALVLLFPFILDRRSSPTSLLFLIAPSLVVGIASSVYQYLVFGDFFRTGYQYWVSVPYDYFSLVFHPQYLWKNLQVAEVSASLLVIALCGLVLRQRIRVQQEISFCDNEVEKRYLLFILLTGTPVLIFHLFYFYSSSRFYLPITSLLVILGGGFAGRLMPKGQIRWFYGLLLIGICSSAFSFYKRLSQVPGEQITVIQYLQSHSQHKTLFLSDINPVFLSFMLGSNVEVLPLSRQAEYASKVMTRQRVPHPLPPPRSAFDHRAQAIQSRSEEVFPVVVEEDEGIVDQALAEQRPVYLYESIPSSSILQQIPRIPIRGSLVKLR